LEIMGRDAARLRGLARGQLHDPACGSVALSDGTQTTSLYTSPPHEGYCREQQRRHFPVGKSTRRALLLRFADSGSESVFMLAFA
jgi:hypothetical protein